MVLSCTEISGKCIIYLDYIRIRLARKALITFRMRYGKELFKKIEPFMILNVTILSFEDLAPSSWLFSFGRAADCSSLCTYLLINTLIRFRLFCGGVEADEPDHLCGDELDPEGPAHAPRGRGRQARQGHRLADRTRRARRQR